MGSKEVSTVANTSVAVRSLVSIDYSVQGKVNAYKLAGIRGLSAVFPFYAFATPVSVVQLISKLGPIISGSGAAWSTSES